MAVTVGQHLRGGKEDMSAMPITTPAPLPGPLPGPLPVLAVVAHEVHEEPDPSPEVHEPTRESDASEPGAEADPNLDPADELASLIQSQARDMADEGLSMRPRRGLIHECDLTASRAITRAVLGKAPIGGLDAIADDRPPLRFVFLDPPSASGLWCGGAGSGGVSDGEARAIRSAGSTRSSKPTAPSTCPVCGGHPEASGRRSYCLRCDKAASDGRVVYGGLDVGAVMNPGWGATNPTRYAPPQQVEVPRGQAEGKGSGKPGGKGSTKPLRGGLG
jgi:hypothetical protein